MRKATLVLLLLSSTLALSADRDFYLANNALKFRAPEEWTVLVEHLTGPATLVTFLIKNPAAETRGASNAVITSLDLRDKNSAKKFKHAVNEIRKEAKDPVMDGDWFCNVFNDHEDRVEYVISDCSRQLGDYGIRVRVAFPLPSEDVPEYGHWVLLTMRSLTGSVALSPK
jgi:hypothetical protein